MKGYSYSFRITCHKETVSLVERKDGRKVWLNARHRNLLRFIRNR